MSFADRSILHVDMDGFFAAVEQRDDPALRGKPVLVGGRPEGRGVVATASYEARAFGCHSAMPMARALRLCPQAIVVSPRLDRYLEASRQVFAIFERFTPQIEPLSIDEAFLDVSGSVRLFGTPVAIARQLKQAVFEQTQLTASVGVAPNKFLAKLASDLRKPDGLVLVPPQDVQRFLDPLPVSRMWGAGKATLPRLEAMGALTFADLRRLGESALRSAFGELGERFHRLARGRDDRPVVSDRAAKSISHEVTFAEDIEDAAYLRSVLLHQTEHVAQRLRRHDRLARTVAIKIRYGDFTTLSRQGTLTEPSDETDVLWAAAADLFETWQRRRPRAVRLIGMGASGLTGVTGRQLRLFEADPASPRRRRLDRAVDAIRERFGDDAVSRGG
jgi:DNA polymerase-4